MLKSQLKNYGVPHADALFKWMRQSLSIILGHCCFHRDAFLVARDAYAGENSSCFVFRLSS